MYKEPFFGIWQEQNMFTVWIRVKNRHKKFSLSSAAHKLQGPI